MVAGNVETDGRVEREEQSLSLIHILFSTHYHELTDMAVHNQSIRNVHVDVHEEDDHITFLYRISDGKADKSYGINVARLAHLPDSVLERANQLLEQLEQQDQGVANIQAPQICLLYTS